MMGITTEPGALVMATQVERGRDATSLTARVMGGSGSIPATQTGRQAKGIVSPVRLLVSGFIAWEPLRTKPGYVCDMHESRVER